MPERNGHGFRERIQFDEPLWREIETLSDHLRLKPADVVRMLTALGVAQMKQLTGLGRVQSTLAPAMEQDMTEDFERMTGVPASTPVAETSTRIAPARPAPVRPAPGQSTAMSAPGRNPVQKNELARVDDRPPSYLRGL
jgi:hypothetical protein